MFILQRQDVEISSVQHPKREQQIPILKYQDQTFRLISVFDVAKAEEAKTFWKDLTDNQGKFCVLLQEENRHSVWGRVKLEQLIGDSNDESSPVSSVQAALLILQAVYFDVEELLGGRQAKLFHQEMTTALQSRQIPQVDSGKAVDQLLKVDPLGNFKAPSWAEQHLIAVLQEVYRIGKEFFGNANFADELDDILLDMPDQDRQDFLAWLKQSTLGKQWKG
ncbi:Npun_F0813 family protein [Spirulina major]|uniref:Npun_F0813 family protein n=1 Tax=Spirulina major TaxID=270636 RepID=UPI000933F19C|nr:Npun_F0813 family protein [Spirulina major]